MPGRREHDGAVGHTFALEVDGTRVTMLSEISGLALGHRVVEMQEGGADGSVAAHGRGDWRSSASGPAPPRA